MTTSEYVFALASAVLVIACGLSMVVLTSVGYELALVGLLIGLFAVMARRFRVRAFKTPPALLLAAPVPGPSHFSRPRASRG
ncbi:MAG: hypothetical protein MJA83_11000 [Gammaproteobacteria bacterium]|nr:hypothetical protein [Gammaproteobacteria bacterium]